MLRLATWLLVCTVSISAYADKVLDEARGHYERAMSAYALGRFGEAATEYEKAFDLKPDPALLYNAAQAHRVAGNKQRALLLYQNYLRVFGDSVSNAEDVRRHIVELKQAIDSEERSKSSPPVGPIPPGTAAVERAPAPSPQPAIAPSAPKAEVRVEAISRPMPSPSKPLVKKPWFWVTIVGAVAVVATGVALGVVYGSPQRDPVASMGVARGN